MNSTLIDSSSLSQALQVSAEHLDKNQEVLNNLNVFPVPDGDTGSNMAATFIPAVRSLKDQTIESCKAMAEFLLPVFNENSRGNSGFILSRFFMGFFKEASKAEYITVKELAQGFAKGLFEVNSSLFDPKPGTMVTIIDRMTQALTNPRSSDPLDSLAQALEEARDALDQTPQMLPLLSKAGVIDSGALGFIMIFDGLHAGLTESPLPTEEETRYRFEPMVLDDNSPLELDKGKQFCIELLVEIQKKVSSKELNQFLASIGNSIALVHDEERIKLHIHSDEPETIKVKLREYGTITKEKVEDMHEQMQAITYKNLITQETKVVCFCPGPGFQEVYKDLGVDHAVPYTDQLPSTGEVMEILEQVDSQNIVLMPNNGNILPSCLAAKEKSQKNIAIIPTKNVIEGLACCYGYSENEELSTNLESMKDSREFTQSLFFYQSADHRVFNGREIPEKHYFTLQGSDLIHVGEDFADVLLNSLKKFELQDLGNVTFFYKDDALLPQLEKIQESLKQDFPELETDCIYGGQHQAQIILALE